MASRLRPALVAALLVLSAPALAEPTAAERETARRLMDEGKARSRAGEHDRAIEAYAKAHEIMHVPTTGLALARAHLASGHLVEARDVALEVVRIPREAGEPAVFERARKQAKELEAQVKGRIPSLRIVVKGGPASSVSIDEADIPVTLLGAPVAVNPGTRVVVAKNADGVGQKAEVLLHEKEEKEVEIVLPEPTEKAAAAPDPSGRSEPWSGGRAAPERRRSTTADVLVFGGFGVAAAGLVVGSITGAMAFGKAGDVKPQCENDVCDPAAASDLDGARGLATVSTVGFVAAGVGALLGAVGLMLPKQPVERAALRSTSPRAELLLAPTGAGLRGSF